jgi:hypothetical protein
MYLSGQKVSDFPADNIRTVVCKLIGASTYFGKIQVLLVADSQNRVVYLGFL